MERRVIDARHVARTGRLVLLRLEGEGVHVDADGRRVLVVLVGLNLVEVQAVAARHAVVAVELQESALDGVLAAPLDVHLRRRVSTRGHGDVARGCQDVSTPDAVVERLEGVAVVVAHRPHKFLTRVVKVQFTLVRGHARANALGSRELELLNDVLVRLLGIALALICVEIDVVDVQASAEIVANSDTSGAHVGTQVLLGSELECDLDFVVLKSNERECKAGVAVEPELKRNVHDIACNHAGIPHCLTGGVPLEHRVVTDHAVETDGMTARLCQLVPDVEPLPEVTVNALTTDLDLDRLDELVADMVDPASSSRRGGSSVGGCNLGQLDLEVRLGQKVAIPRHAARDAATEADSSVESLLDSLHGKVRMATVNGLEERNLGVASQVLILRAVGHQLH